MADKYDGELEEILDNLSFYLPDEVSNLNHNDLPETKAKLSALLRRAEVEAKVKSKSGLLNRLVSTYRKINPPIKQSPMELSEEAKLYNKFVDDLYKFVDIERDKIERLQALLPRSPQEGESDGSC